MGRSPPDERKNDLKWAPAMTYGIDWPGIYAVILKPVFKPPHEKPEAFTGILQQNRVTVFLVLFFYAPIIFLIVGVILDYTKFHAHFVDIKEDADNMDKQLKGYRNITVDFLGEKIKEKVDLKIEYYTNKIHNSYGLEKNEMIEINKETDKIEEEKLELDKQKKALYLQTNNTLRKIHEYRTLISDLENPLEQNIEEGEYYQDNIDWNDEIEQGD